MRDSSWLCPTPGHRERFLDMQERLRLARLLTIVMGAVVAAALAPRVGTTLIVACIAMVAIVVIGGARLDRRRRPELWIFASTVLNIQLALAAGVVVTGGPKTNFSCLLVIPVVMVAARFSNRGLIIGAPISAALIVATTLGADPGYVVAHPESIVVPLALVLCCAAYLSPLVASDVRHRADSTLDQLTGLLNRRALEPRFAEVAEQAALARQPISLVALDIDHFKAVNDQHGHAMGDAVLRDVAYALRQNLRTFELLYRLGGEEFLLLLPGADRNDASRIAETLRAAVERLHPGGLAITCSFGVATSSGDAAAFAPLMEDVDAALYAAKRLGRNRVQHADTAALVTA
jgi:diguanylate cyclase (GGDEF)-like protein